MLLERSDLRIRNEQADLEYREMMRKRYSERNAQQAITAPQHQWNNTRFLLQSPLFSRRGRALEFGCDFGASAIMLAALGWKVTGIDVKKESISIAKLNAARYGVESEFLYVPDSRQLPFEEGTFDLVSANSVLEYVYPRTLLPGIYREIDRVLKPGGFFLSVAQATV